MMTSIGVDGRTDGRMKSLSGKFADGKSRERGRRWERTVDGYSYRLPTLFLASRIVCCCRLFCVPQNRRKTEAENMRKKTGFIESCNPSRGKLVFSARAATHAAVEPDAKIPVCDLSRLINFHPSTRASRKGREGSQREWLWWCCHANCRGGRWS